MLVTVCATNAKGLRERRPVIYSMALVFSCIHRIFCSSVSICTFATRQAINIAARRGSNRDFFLTKTNSTRSQEKIKRSIQASNVTTYLHSLRQVVLGQQDSVVGLLLPDVTAAMQPDTTKQKAARIP